MGGMEGINFVFDTKSEALLHQYLCLCLAAIPMMDVQGL